MSEVGSADNPFESVFDAVRCFASSSILLQLEKDESGVFRRSNHYEIVDMMDGTLAAFPDLMSFMCYRGENGVFPTCEASIFRNNRMDDTHYDLDAILIDELRCEEFKTILLTFPQVEYAMKDHMRVDFLALAQHYELNTRLLDYTSAPEIAAYFATHKFSRNGVAFPIESGIGCIRGTSSFCYMTPDMLYSRKFHPIGLQCFERPGLQCAYGLETEMGEDCSNNGWTVYFKQNALASWKIHVNFHFHSEVMRVLPYSWLFPDEEIANVANIVKTAKTISEQTVIRYCEENEKDFDEVRAVMQSRRIRITEKPVYVLSVNRKLELVKEYSGSPYGNVQLNARFCYMPPA